jgi:ferredoxin
VTIRRRELLAAALGAGAAAAALRPRPAEARLRPPGAASEEDFVARGVRCFRCAEVCPPAAIRLDGSPLPAAADLPHLVPEERGCTLCLRCTEVCPTGALLPIAATAEARLAEVRMGRAVVDRGSCLPWTRRGPCRSCWHACPFPDVAIRLRGPALAPVVEDACVGCGLCAEACPAEVKAIAIVPAGAPR